MTKMIAAIAAMGCIVSLASGAAMAERAPPGDREKAAWRGGDKLCEEMHVGCDGEVRCRCEGEEAQRRCGDELCEEVHQGRNGRLGARVVGHY